MCGILFYNVCKEDVNEDTNIDTNIDIFKNAFSKIQHRGPDHSGFKIIESRKSYCDLFFGCHRLAITNPTDIGNQPLELNNIILICNGQIFNYLKLAEMYSIPIETIRTDVDIILHLYIKGLSIKEICEKLDGVFAFVLYDKNTKSTFIGRDPIGIRPLFWARHNSNLNVIAVSSEIKGFDTLILNKNIIIEVFSPNHCYSIIGIDNIGLLEEYSDIYKSVDTCDISLGLCKKHNNYSKPGNKAFDTRRLTDIPILNSEIHNNIYELLKKAVIKRIDNSDKPVAFLCSGGIDSSIIFCIARDYLKTKNRILHAFSMKFNDNSTSYDAFYAKLLMDQYKDDPNVKYHSVSFNWEQVLEIIEKIPKQLETYDPNTIRASIPMYLLAKHLKNTEFKVFLSGEGADELFMGYNYFKQVPDEKEANKESIRLLKNIHMFDVLRADRTFNANGLELRVPYLDLDFIKYVKQLPGSLKMYYNNVEKALLRESVRNKHPELVYSRVIDREKERFSDGCGFNYIPKLLNYICEKRGNVNNKSRNLNEKEKIEKEYYLELFENYYGNDKQHLIITRKLPNWCNNDAKNMKLID